MLDISPDSNTVAAAEPNVEKASIVYPNTYYMSPLLIVSIEFFAEKDRSIDRSQVQKKVPFTSLNMLNKQLIAADLLKVNKTKWRLRGGLFFGRELRAHFQSVKSASLMHEIGRAIYTLSPPPEIETFLQNKNQR